MTANDQPDEPLLSFVALCLAQFGDGVRIAHLRTTGGEIGRHPVDACLACGGVVAPFISCGDVEPEQLPAGWKLRGKQPS